MVYFGCCLFVYSDFDIYCLMALICGFLGFVLYCCLLACLNAFSGSSEFNLSYLIGCLGWGFVALFVGLSDFWMGLAL